jgi:hypothetical protein
MKKLFSSLALFTIAIFMLQGCGNLNIPTNTTGGIFSLNGTWKLKSTTDGSALVGTTIVVYPVLGNATIKTVENNTYCVKEKDDLWKSIKTTTTGGFTISELVSACNGTIIYRDGIISVVNNDEITVSSRTADNKELVQLWDRVK